MDNDIVVISNEIKSQKILSNVRSISNLLDCLNDLIHNIMMEIFTRGKNPPLLKNLVL